MEKLIVSATEAAQILGTSPNSIQEALESGDLPAYKEGRNWKIPRTMLEQYVEERAVREAAERRRKRDAV